MDSDVLVDTDVPTPTPAQTPAGQILAPHNCAVTRQFDPADYPAQPNAHPYFIIHPTKNFRCQGLPTEETFYVDRASISRELEGISTNAEALTGATDGAGRWQAVPDHSVTLSPTYSLIPPWALVTFDPSDAYSSVSAAPPTVVAPREEVHAVATVEIQGGIDVTCDVRLYSKTMSGIIGQQDRLTDWRLNAAAAPTGLQVSLTTVLAHEFGHCLGFDHPGSGSDAAANALTELSIMRPGIRPAPTAEHPLSPADIAAIQFVYPTSISN